jgi:hypothetical protein
MLIVLAPAGAVRSIKNVAASINEVDYEPRKFAA